MTTLTVIDADSIIFTIAWKFRNKKSSNFVKMATDEFIKSVLDANNTDAYIGYYALKDAEGIRPNFRYNIDPKYKANRPDTPDFVKKWRGVIHEKFKNKWGFISIDGMEADDAVTFTVEHYRNDYDKIVVATFDKDLKQIPNIEYYNMKTHKSELIDELTAATFFYTQMLVGDSGDNIKGVPGIGKVTAKNLLKDKTTKAQLHSAVARQYKIYGDKKTNQEIKKIKDSIAETINSETYPNLTPAQLDRKIRIELKKRNSEIFDWKKYFKQQTVLLQMLTTSPDWFTIPSPIEYQVLNKVGDNMLDDFLNETDEINTTL